MKKNVQLAERAVTLAIAALFLGRGMRRKGLRGLPALLASGALGMRGLTGYCSIYNALGISSVPRRSRRDIELSPDLPINLQRSVIIRRKPDEVYSYISKFNNLGPILDKMKRLHRRGTGNNRWSFDLPMGKRVNVDVKVTKKDPPSEIIFRSSRENAKDLHYEGKLHLEPKSGGNRTVMTMTLALKPSGGFLGTTIASSLSTLLEGLLKEGLRQIKQLLETGELATTAGQPQGGHLIKKVPIREEGRLELEVEEQNIATPLATQEEKSKQSGRVG